MGQFGSLLWKNFMYCRVHPIKTLLFFLIPLVFCSFLLLTTRLIEIKNVGDCDYQKVALPPSNPLLLVSSLVCADVNECGNDRPYADPADLLTTLTASADEYDSAYSRLCPMMHKNDTEKLRTMVLKNTCLKRNEDDDYEALNPIDLIFRGQIIYYPDSPEAKQIMDQAGEYFDTILDILPIAKNLSDYIGYLNSNYIYVDANLTAVASGLLEYAEVAICYKNIASRLKAVDTRSEAIQAARELNFTDDVVWAIVELNKTELYDFTYKIVSHYGMRDSLSSLYLQSAIEAATVQVKSAGPNDERQPLGSNIFTKLLPRRCMKSPAAYGPAFSSAMFVIGLGFIMVSYVVTSQICAEKASGLLEFLFISGVPRWKIRLTWFIFGGVFYVAIALMIGAIFKFIDSKLIEHTNIGIIMIVMLIYALSMLSMCFLVASLMSTPQKASIVIFCSILAAYFVPSWIRIVPNVGYTGGTLFFVRLLSFLHSTVAAEVGFAYIFAWESLNQGLTFSRITGSPDPEDGFRGLGECLLYMLFQIPFYLALSWYFDHVAPSKYGIKWPLYFPFMPSYYNCCVRSGEAEGTEKEHHGETADLDENGNGIYKKKRGGHQDAAADMEELDNPKPVGIQLSKLTKRYGKDFYAVKDLTMGFIDKEITVLLGHNGAGKSTTMNMLTGMIEPTSGAAIIQHRNLRGQMSEIRQDLGFCPQYDIIYPDLTVRHHLSFYGDLRGMAQKEIQTYTEEIFGQMNMMEALDRKASDLSGGMKRKLSIGVALLGRPSTIILDEPTSAIDPFSRRAIWDVILSCRDTSTFIVSTHYMEEADVLADRIAILDAGRLKCLGSPMYLKAQYGSGFKLILAHQRAIDVDDIGDNLKEIIPLSVEQKTKTETTFAIDLVTARSEKMIEVLEYLEGNQERHGYSSFGVAESTMEQVFFNVAEKKDHEDHAVRGLPPSNYTLDDIDYCTARGIRLGLHQMWGTWIKRFHLARKSIVGFIFQVFAPLLLTMFLLLMNRTIAKSGLSNEERLVNVWEFNEKQLLFLSTTLNQSGGPIGDSMRTYGISWRCFAKTPVKSLSCLDEPAASLPEATEPAATGPGVCSCDTCPADAVDPKPQSMTILSQDEVINLAGRNLTEYLIKHSRRDELIGGVEETMTNTPVPNYFEAWAKQIGEEIGVDDIADSVFIQVDRLLWDNFTEMDTVLWTGMVDPPDRRPTKMERQMRSMRSALLNAYFNAFWRTRYAFNGKSIGIVLYKEEMSMNNEISTAQTVAGIILGFFGSLALLMPVFPVILVIVNEKSSGNKRLQFLMGLNAWVYWMSNFIWDVLLFLLSICLMLIFMATFPNDFKIKIEYFLTTGLLYGVSMICLSYVLSFMVRTARLTILVVGQIAPFFSIAALILLGFLTKSWYDNVNLMLNFFPPYFITDSLITIGIQDNLPEMVRKPLMDWSNLGKRYTMNGLFTIAMILVLIAFELGLFHRVSEGCYDCCCRISNAVGSSGEGSSEQNRMDEDVLNEQNRIMNGPPAADEEDALIVQDIRKVYKGNKVAVKGISFGVNKGECFGLLGTNGAGKTTLFKMLSGFHDPTSGDAKILGHSIFQESAKTRRLMSYCPQEDVLFDSLTPLEHLKLYCRIRGIPGKHHHEVVHGLAEKVSLSPHLKKQSHSLSGGNKRKLNFAIAMLDFPSVIFLDEMTTGMDPKARRAAWDCLSLAVKRGSSVIITSHSMEECEALCNRIVIMVNGRLECIGGVQYLKDKFGNSYDVKLKVSKEASAEQLKTSFLNVFEEQDARVVEEYPGFVQFQMGAQSLKLSKLFRFIHNAKEPMKIQQFTASQTTLEHVFINFAKKQL